MATTDCFRVPKLLLVFCTGTLSSFLKNDFICAVLFTFPSFQFSSFAEFMLVHFRTTFFQGTTHAPHGRFQHVMPSGLPRRNNIGVKLLQQRLVFWEDAIEPTTRQDRCEYGRCSSLPLICCCCYSCCCGGCCSGCYSGGDQGRFPCRGSRPRVPDKDLSQGQYQRLPPWNQRQSLRLFWYYYGESTGSHSLAAHCPRSRSKTGECRWTDAVVRHRHHPRK